MRRRREKVEIRGHTCPGGIMASFQREIFAPHSGKVVGACAGVGGEGVGVFERSGWGHGGQQDFK